MLAKVSIFEQELETLRDEVKQCKEQMQREQEKAALAIERANKRRPAVGGIRPGVAASAISSNPKKGLKFNKPAAANDSNAAATGGGV